MAGKGGKREGAGRKKAPHTIESEKAREVIVDRVTKNLQPLLDAQLSLAKGQSFLYKIVTKKVGTKAVREKPVLVTDPEEIASYIDWMECGGDSMDDDTTYYYMTTKPPENQALDSLLNRAFGKPKEALQLEGPGGGPVQITWQN